MARTRLGNDGRTVIGELLALAVGPALLGVCAAALAAPVAVSRLFGLPVESPNAIAYVRTLGVRDGVLAALTLAAVRSPGPSRLATTIGLSAFAAAGDLLLVVTTAERPLAPESRDPRDRLHRPRRRSGRCCAPASDGPLACPSGYSGAMTFGKFLALNIGASLAGIGVGALVAPKTLAKMYGVGVDSAEAVTYVKGMGIRDGIFATLDLRLPIAREPRRPHRPRRAPDVRRRRRLLARHRGEEETAAPQRRHQHGRDPRTRRRLGDSPERGRRGLAVSAARPGGRAPAAGSEEFHEPGFQADGVVTPSAAQGETPC